MIVRIQGFAWEVYMERVMPAFASWLVDGDDTNAYHLFEQTRCAQEELFVPQPMRQLRTWTRAKAFVQSLPRGSHTQQEYMILCDPVQFTRLSDRYVQTHPPQLHKDSEALRTVWGALTQQFCLPWYDSLTDDFASDAIAPLPLEDMTPAMHSTELISLLQSAGLSDLVTDLHQTIQARTPIEPLQEMYFLSDDSLDAPSNGVVIGRLPTPLHIRGWLATHSVRAMALFELLACGRRAMPFGYLAGDPYGNYIGYLTPTETAWLAASLEGIQAPNDLDAEADYQSFLHHQQAYGERLIDEVQPAHASTFLDAVRIASQQQLGLICSVG